MSRPVARVDAGVPQGGQFAASARPDGDVALEAGLVLAGAPVPVIHLEGLTHVGKLDPTSKGTNSYEGQGLSVSLHPEEWQQIARLGGTVWSIGPAHPARFLDYHELTEPQREEVAEYGTNAGYVTRETVYRVTYWDGEWEEERYFTQKTREDAEYEAEDLDATITEVPALIATDTFPDSTVNAGDTDIDQILATVWVNEVATEFDGVWWEDNLDVDTLSAPRGVIVPRAIPAWLSTARPADI